MLYLFTIVSWRWEMDGCGTGIELWVGTRDLNFR